jgi:hypothetical protein
MTVKSRYRFTEAGDRFEVSAEARGPVRVVYAPYRFRVECRGRPAKDFGLFEYRRLVEEVANGLMNDWQGRGEHTPGRVRDWAVEQTRRAIGRRVLEQTRRLAALSPPEVLAVQRTVFATTLRCHECLACPEFYQDRWLVKDVLNYRAARAALFVLPDEGWQQAMFPTVLGTSPDWKACYSDTGQPYTSLNRTLMNLPGGLPPPLLRAAALLHFDHPVTERLPLLAVLGYARALDVVRERTWRQAPNWREAFAKGPRPGCQDVVLKATESQVAAAVRKVAGHMHQDLSPRRTTHVCKVMSFLADFPEPHTGYLTGLAEKAISWHRHRAAKEVEDVVRQLGADRATARPPELPAIPGVRFLDTVAAVVEEGQRMENCVGGYATGAVYGSCYLFHVEHDGEEATVEVCPTTRRVRQSEAPRNRQNGASRWGRRVLQRWAKNLPEPEANSIERCHGAFAEAAEIPF